MRGAITGAIPYLIIYLFAGVCLMRILREEGKLSAGRHAHVLLALLLGSVIFAALQAHLFILNAAGFIYKNIISWIVLDVAFAIAAVFYGIVWIVSRSVSPNVTQ